jgi:hypothetical protein
MMSEETKRKERKYIFLICEIRNSNPLMTLVSFLGRMKNNNTKRRKGLRRMRRLIRACILPSPTEALINLVLTGG